MIVIANEDVGWARWLRDALHPCLRLLVFGEVRDDHRGILPLIAEEVLDLIDLSSISDEVEEGDEKAHVLLLFGLKCLGQGLEQQSHRQLRERSFVLP
jgi:hypothetical protein